MAENWAVMAHAVKSNANRACVLCGVACSGKSYHAGILLEDLQSTAGLSLLQSATLNICAAAIRFADERDEPIATVVMCPSCNHWTQRRKAAHHFITPLALLHLYINTLETIDGKTFDSRVLHRLSVTLSDPGNYYRHMFSETELALFGDIARSTQVHAHAKTMAHYASMHGMLFCASRKPSETLRHHLVNAEPIEGRAAAGAPASGGCRRTA